MKKTLLPLIACAAMTAISLTSLADHTPEHDEMMKRCMAKQDSSMTKEEAMRKCSDEVNKSKMKKPRMPEPAATPEPDPRW